MAYNLFTTGKTDLYRYTSIFSMRKIARDALSGVVDSANKVYFTTYQPLLTSGSTAVYVGATLQSSTAYTVLPETGEIDFVTAPTSQAYANYTFASLSDVQLNRILMAGFDEMETRWPRSFRLTTSLSSYSAVDETATNAYVVPRNSLADPPSGDDAFSTQQIQIAFLMKCCKYANLAAKSEEEAATAMSYREASGMTVNTLQRVPNLERVLERLDGELKFAMQRAQEVYWTDGRSLGGAILNPMTEDYKTHYEWQSESKQEDIRNQDIS